MKNFELDQIILWSPSGARGVSAVIANTKHEELGFNYLFQGKSISDYSDFEVPVLSENARQRSPFSQRVVRIERLFSKFIEVSLYNL